MAWDKNNPFDGITGTMTHDFNYTEIETIPLNKVYDYVKNSVTEDWYIVRIEPFYNQQKFLNDIRQNAIAVPFMKKDPELYSESYEGISIQRTKNEKTATEENYGTVARNSLPGEPIFLASEEKQVVYFTRQGFSRKPPPEIDLIKNPSLDLQQLWKELNAKPTVSAPQYLNTWAKPWTNFLLTFAGLGLINIRGRYLRSYCGQYAKRHTDKECRLHVPLWTNDKCFTAFFDEKDNYKQAGKFNMPADGSAYLFNAHRVHSFGNFGDEIRTHAVFGITHQTHRAWKYFQPHLETYEDVLIDYANDLMSFKKK